MSHAMPIIAAVSAAVTVVTGFLSVKGATSATGGYQAMAAEPTMHASDHPTQPELPPIPPPPALRLPDHPSGPWATMHTTRHAATVYHGSGPMPRHAKPVESSAVTIAASDTPSPTPTRSYEAPTAAQPVYTPKHTASSTPPPAPPPPTSDPAPTVAAVGAAAKAIAFAVDQLGKPYIYGGTGPEGFDCSGLTYAAYAAAGVTIPRTSEAQWAELPHVSTSDLQPGDILVFTGADHVALYVGNNEMIDAPHQGAVVEKVLLAGYWQSVLIGAVAP